MEKLDEIYHVQTLLECKMYNGIKIINTIAHEEIIKLLDNQK